MNYFRASFVFVAMAGALVAYGLTGVVAERSPVWLSIGVAACILLGAISFGAHYFFPPETDSPVLWRKMGLRERHLRKKLLQLEKSMKLK